MNSMNEPPFARYFWLMAIAVTVVNALLLKFRSRFYVQKRPELAAGYRRLFQGLLLWGNLPWVVMDYGILFGGVHDVFSYLHFREGNPFVLAWVGLMVLMWLLGFYWLFVAQGAEFLIEHPGLLHGKVASPTMIRVIYCLCVASGIVAFCLFAFLG